jgi:peptidoglycan/xylan/chitin deacetylase (PgdA/CDA1 family)
MSRGAPVLTYHKIAAAPARSRDPFLYVAPAIFDQQLRALRQAGYSSGSLDDLLPIKVSQKVVLTFDDGFGNVVEHGLSILAKNQFHAIQFLVAGALGAQNSWDISKGDTPERLMDKGQVKQWLAAGHQIGSHSMSHRNLKKLSEADLREEIFASKKLLEDQFGVEVRHFCYPFGGYNDRVRDLVEKAGYRTASTVVFGVNDADTSPFELKRIIPLSNREMLRKIRHRAMAKVSRRR